MYEKIYQLKIWMKQAFCNHVKKGVKLLILTGGGGMYRTECMTCGKTF